MLFMDFMERIDLAIVEEKSEVETEDVSQELCDINGCGQTQFMWSMYLHIKDPQTRGCRCRLTKFDRVFVSSLSDQKVRDVDDLPGKICPNQMVKLSLEHTL